ncbi:hypothetical protein BLNAU_17760 [Blattamonas nauphoetae]|uniref:SEP domain-containing protein n=1 Tax=Blattamonas nauphoetae TaxID=2049346 RepID=A0ABQ9X6A2_9EUKA|nr:hypothetical protein BLNAU_17760 [Blattamonas nauphoetae]
MPEAWKQPQQEKPRFGNMQGITAQNSRSGDKGVDRHMSNDGQSGNYTIDPRKKNADENDPLARLMQAAQQRSQQPPPDSDSEDEPAARPAFEWSGGSSVGGTDMPSQSFGSQAKPKAAAPQNQGPQSLKLVLYRNALQVDENPPVYDTDPSFLEYVEEITGGHFPHALAPPGSRGPFNVGLVDRRQKDLPPPPKDPFAGGGYSLGGEGFDEGEAGKKGKKGQPAPKVTVTPLPQQDTPALSELQGGTFIVQARFTDTNTTHKFTMREGSTLGDLEREIVALLQTKKVDISQPFPRVVFSAGDRKKTLAELNLKNASVIVKVV